MFWGFFLARRTLADIGKPLNYANLCTWPSSEQFICKFDFLIVKYYGGYEFIGEKCGIFCFYRAIKLCVLIKKSPQGSSVRCANLPACDTLVLAPECVPWVCAPIRAAGSKHGRIWIRQCACLSAASLHIDPNSEYCRCSPEGAYERGACPWHTLWREPRGLGKGLFACRGREAVRAPETTQKGSEQNFAVALRAPNRGSS